VSKFRHALQPFRSLIRLKQVVDLLFELAQVRLGMLKLITDNLQTNGPSDESRSSTHGMLSKLHQALSRVAPIGTGGYLLEGGSNCLNAR
jgi:hypothetical protein